MRSVLVWCLILNVSVSLASGTLLLWYPKDRSFTVTTPVQTVYIEGGVFLGAVLLCLFDIAMAAYLAWRICHPTQ